MNILGKQASQVLVVVALLVCVAMVGVLAHVASLYRQELDSDVMVAVRAFESSGALKQPDDPRVDFNKIEDLARSFVGGTRIRNLYVTKLSQRGDQTDRVVLYPYTYEMDHPMDWQQSLDALRREPIRLEKEEVGALYFDLDTTTLSLVRVSISIAIFLIFLAVLALSVRIFRQEQTLAVTTEILEQNRRELIRMERLSLAGLLTANIFHDIRKPMTNIKHELADLTEALGGFAGATRALRNMRTQVTLFFDILRDLNLERFVRADEVDEEYVDVNRVMEQALNLVQYERGATRLHLRLKPGLPLVLAHPYRLVQVFSNLILNAYQALGGRGELRVATGLDPLLTGNEAVATEAGEEEEGAQSAVPATASEGLAQGTKVVIVIADNGPGISAEHLHKIFSPFYSTKSAEGGAGLGLYISRSIIEDLGGTLSVESAEGTGTRFRIVLPAAD
ncbi:MAG TPA: ATP-binding protein [Candidatus Sumerlaeota bacterium]|nr:ATP-binding protein [Candidatus Sumerlaeota bacterium]